MNRLKFALVLALAAVCFAHITQAQRTKSSQAYRGWPMFGGGEENIHYSTLSQITRENVGQLQVAWQYDSGDAYDNSENQCNPIVIDGVLYATTPRLRVVALDAATGKERWSFDPNEGRKGFGKMRNRGLTYWQEGADKRIFVGYRNRLYALDATTGQPIKSFGEAAGQQGWIDLRKDLGREQIDGLTIMLATPGVIYGDTIIIGGLVSEGLPALPGDIRAYDVRTGKLRWSFHTIPHKGEVGYETWPKDAWQYIGGANNWAGMVVDQKRGLVFAPTGSAAFDFYGANRHGDNLFANTLLCLDAKTGKRVWHFQAVKHDVWDRDFPSAPQLVTVKRNGKTIDAVAQITKSGHVYLFERESGKPLFPIETKPYAQSQIPGEQLAATQALPTLPEPFARQRLTEDLLTQRTPEAHQFALNRFKQIRSNGQFEPPSAEGTVIFPGFDGGGEWGGAAFDPETNLLYVNANEMAWILTIVPKAKAKRVSGQTLYEANCANCHQKDLSGSPPEFPSLKNIATRIGDQDMRGLIRNGVGRMPGFARLGSEAIQAIAMYVLTGKDELVSKEVIDAPANNPIDLAYTHTGYNKFLDNEGYPAVAPPWGTLNAIDLNTGRIAWKVPFGFYPELAAKGLGDTGSENYGGGIVTRNGLFFIGATNYDKKFRVFDKTNGKLLWETELPAAGNATPAMYEVNGRQFVVIAAGGGKGSKSGGSYVAFALPVDPSKTK